MLKRLLLLIILGLCVSLTNAQDDPTGGVITGIVAINNAEVRLGPDFAYDSINQLPLNASVTITGRAGTFYSRWNGQQWLRIQYGDSHAWVYARLIRTSTAFNSIPPVGMLLPRTRDGRVPSDFDLSSDICSQWAGTFGTAGNPMAGDNIVTLTVPPLQGANLYRAYIFLPGSELSVQYGTWVRFESTTNVIEIDVGRLPRAGGVYTWRAAPYWSDGDQYWQAQQVCLLQTGGTFEKPETVPSVDGG